MTIQVEPSRSRRRLGRALDALFREARLLERRRRRRHAVLAILVCAIAAAVGYLLYSGAGSTHPAAGDRPLSVTVSSLTLPRSGQYVTLAVVDGRLILSGGSQGSLFPAGGIATTSSGRLAPLNSRPSASCNSAAITSTLRLTDRMSANCADPDLYHEHAIAVTYWVVRDHSTWIDTRIARVDPAAPDRYTLGPVVMRYEQCSDCWAQQVYGDGSLWIYDGFTAGFTRREGELLRVSESTGTVVQRWAMPSLDRPLVAVDADGFWLAPSGDSGWPGGLTPTQRIFYQSLYRVSPGARTPTRVLTIGPDGALWLVASGHTVWLDVGDFAVGPQVLWRLEGTAATPTLHASYPARAARMGEFGEGAPTYAGDAAIGIYYVTTAFPATSAATQRIVRLSPDAASERTVAAIPAPRSVTPNSFAFSSPAAVTVDGSFFFLDPPGATSTLPARGTSVLYRVTPRSRP